MKPLSSFASKFGAQIALNPELIVERAQRYYLINPNLRKIVRKEFFYAGLYLGKVKNGIFFPSFNFLNTLVEVAINKVILDKKSSWLFVCGRDVFSKSLQKTQGSLRIGDFTLVLNEYDECLGFGMIVDDLNSTENKVVVKNILDVGDFLRRER